MPVEHVVMQFAITLAWDLFSFCTFFSFHWGLLGNSLSKVQWDVQLTCIVHGVFIPVLIVQDIEGIEPDLPSTASSTLWAFMPGLREFSTGRASTAASL